MLRRAQQPGATLTPWRWNTTSAACSWP